MNNPRLSKKVKLTHFDVVRFHTIDPMHNIFLGLSKRTVKVWKEKKLIKPSDFELLQSKVDMVNPPPNIGRIPRKIESGFASFTADQWKHWILIYSCFSLNGILPPPHYDCWLHFVGACKLLCQMSITKKDIVSAHNLLVTFCKTYEHLYGIENCTPNMHMACHLKECLLDYGPIAAFWCFSFEQGMSLSWLGPEKQMFLKFNNLQCVLNMLEDNSHNSSNDFAAVAVASLQKFTVARVHDSVEQTTFESTNEIHFLSCSVSEIDCRVNSHHHLHSPLTERVFDDIQLQYLQEMYNYLYSPASYDLVQPSRFYLASKQVTINGSTFISTKSRSKRSSAVIAHWPGVLNRIDSRGEAPLRAGVVTFFRHELKLKQCRAESVVNTTNILAHVMWLESHPYRDKYLPKSFVSATTYTSDSCASFIPVARIAGHCAIAETEVKFDYGEDRVIVCIPIMKNILI